MWATVITLAMFGMADCLRAFRYPNAADTVGQLLIAAWCFALSYAIWERIP